MWCVQVAKVYVSVYGDERGQTIAMEGLKSREGYVRSGLGKRMRLRVTPVVRFIKDESYERGSKVREGNTALWATPHQARLGVGPPQGVGIAQMVASHECEFEYDREHGFISVGEGT